MDAEPSAPPTIAVALARDIASHLADGVTDPVAMLELLHSQRSYRWVSLRDCARQMRALTGDTTQLARQIVRARSAQTMLEVLDDGEPRDKIQVLAKWGPEPNVEDSRGSLTIVVGGSANVQINIGQRVDTPQDIAVGVSLTEGK